MNHLGTLNIETPRLRLRQFDKKDSGDMFKNWGSDSKVTEFLSWSPHRDIHETEEILTDWVLLYENENTYNWAIELKETQEIVGNIKVVKIEEPNASCEIGYCIGSEFWNRGITTEALQGVIEFLFSKIHFNRIAAKHDLLNVASGEVMKKCNMTYEVTLREVKFKNNRFCSLAVYSILNSEWMG